VFAFVVVNLGATVVLARRATTGVSVGIAGRFAGPAGAWAVAGVGLFLVLLGTAAVIARRQRA
jgi:hypothetical protein